jgi:hypothetical protein
MHAEGERKKEECIIIVNTETHTLTQAKLKLYKEDCRATDE